MTERPTKRVADSRAVTSTLMNPQDANPFGNVHGGAVMKLVDETGGIAAMRHAGAPAVTVAVDSMTFVQPILVGNLVTCRAELTYVGQTSIEVRVEVTAEDLYTGKSSHTNTAYVVYVALGADGRPIQVPQLVYETPVQAQRAQMARERQAFRKLQREREDNPTV